MTHTRATDDSGGVRGAMDVTGVPLERLERILGSRRGGNVRLKRRGGRTYLVSAGRSGTGGPHRDADATGDDGRIAAGVDRIELTQ